ncbi:hypothetical protein BO71DRAFT_399951 [Aspergillus ellipticus CBS 707.79]|uniref:5'-3' DNA helicase ZGRF1-like N-terminal domain-containing protein n=1 Tax=Aspergillus ellipticus CBS 707.79 TaxID=1448320 RepID=A0A319DYB1_9EURO|nr:hypothetical protein BO71DRAFT_399951 [Aspergillus ellipticus CBS 707.79]
MATPRSTPSMNVPATQNTAPVIKFRCLYTHDMRRKAKRWQDGYLRYHTFNKRIMVYDTIGNFMGDHHWRQDDEIQDGDELELDNGVLIEVGESVERTETDISNLHSKKKPHKSPARPGDTQQTYMPTPSVQMSMSMSTPTPAPTRSSQPMRSLNDLLGIRKSSTPTQHSDMPREERHMTRNTEDERDRPAKRQRTAVSSTDRPLDRRQRAVIGLTDSTAPDHAPTLPAKETIRPRTDDPHHRANRDRSTKDKPSKDKHKHKTPHDDPPTSPEQPQPPPPPQAQPKSKPQTSNLLTDPPINKLRLSTGKQRRKMLYQPPNTASTTTTSTTTTTTTPAPAPAAKTPTSRPHSQPQPQPKPKQHTPQLIQDPTPTDLDLDLIQTSSESESEPPHPHPHPHSHVHPQQQPQPQAIPRAIPHLQSGLRKAYSDPTALATPSTFASRRHRPSDHDGDDGDEEPEQGPWTREARYLFDFWPPGREKVP